MGMREERESLCKLMYTTEISLKKMTGILEKMLMSQILIPILLICKIVNSFF